MQKLAKLPTCIRQVEFYARRTSRDIYLRRIPLGSTWWLLSVGHFFALFLPPEEVGSSEWLVYPLYRASYTCRSSRLSRAGGREQLVFMIWCWYALTVWIMAVKSFKQRWESVPLCKLCDLTQWLLRYLSTLRLPSLIGKQMPQSEHRQESWPV